MSVIYASTKPARVKIEAAAVAVAIAAVAGAVMAAVIAVVVIRPLLIAFRPPAG